MDKAIEIQASKRVLIYQNSCKDLIADSILPSSLHFLDVPLSVLFLMSSSAVGQANNPSLEFIG